MWITITWKLTAWNTKRHWNWLSRYLLSFAKLKFYYGCSSIVYIYDNYDFICHNNDSILPYYSLCPIFGMITTFHTFVFTVHLYIDIRIISPQCRIYASVNRVSIGLYDGLLPIRDHAIIWTKAGILLIEPLGTNFREILIEIHIFPFMKLHLKLLSAKWQTFCLGLILLITVTMNSHPVHIIVYCGYVLHSLHSSLRYVEYSPNMWFFLQWVLINALKCCQQLLYVLSVLTRYLLTHRNWKATVAKNKFTQIAQIWIK